MLNILISHEDVPEEFRIYTSRELLSVLNNIFNNFNADSLTDTLIRYTIKGIEYKAFLKNDGKVFVRNNSDGQTIEYFSVYNFIREMRILKYGENNTFMSSFGIKEE